MDVPRDVQDWHGASTAIVTTLRDCVGTDRAHQLLDRLVEQIDRGRDMLAGRDPYGRSNPATAPSTTNPGEDPGTPTE